MGAPKQVNKLSQQFESPAFEGVTRAQTGNARLLHVNLVISWLRDLADSESYADNAKAKEALNLLSDGQIEELKMSLTKGGRKRK